MGHLADRFQALLSGAGVPPFVRWLRWTAAGLAVGTAAMALAMLLTMRTDSVGAESDMLAQRLELFEDLPVVQDREALEDLEVVSVLHTLGAQP
jgi:hypothetical protein